MIVTLLTVPIISGDTVTYTDEETKTFVIENDGIEAITLDISTIGSGFEIINSPDTTLDPDETTDLIIKSVVDVPGDFSRDITINAFVMTLEVSIESETVVYTTRESVERTYGRENVLMWADRDGSRDENDIESTIYQACVDATNVINSLMEDGYYEVPFTEVPVMVEMLARKKVAHLLYVSMAIQSDAYDKMMAINNKWFHATIEKINARVIILTDATTFNTETNAPFNVIKPRTCYDPPICPN